MPGKKVQGLCQTCQIPIGTGRVGIFSWKGRIGFAVRRSGRRCPTTILTTLGLLSGTQVDLVNYVPSVFEVTLLTLAFSFSAHTHPHITNEQEEFIHRILEIPLEDRKCRNLIILDTIHLYSGSPEPSAEARTLEEFARRRE